MIATIGDHALAVEVQCPASIAIKETLDQTPPDKWAVRADTSIRYLAGATFFDGNPDQQRSLAPSRDLFSPGKGKDKLAIWQFARRDVPIWLSCRYQDTGISLTKELPNTFKECRVSYGPGLVIKSIQCE